MSLALARKYRPKNFASVAVQSHVSNTLKGAIARGRVAHGYLLCGPRGTGKTTLARVLAMALNCERRVQAQGGGAEGAGRSASQPTLAREAGEPCGECSSCQRIWSGASSLDVVEIDAASNRGVDDARELRERAMYAPTGEDRYKVYIVDEAHMLTREAWNALLKILEEPPPRVVFVFATTEPQKIAQAAAPVLSRLQRFDLKRIGAGEIRERLAAVLGQEGIAVEPEALAMIARSADGGLRDALSLTDQVLSMGEGALTADRVREALGLVAEDEYLALLDLIAERRAGDVFGAVQRLADEGADLAAVLTGLADMLRAQLAVTLGGAVPDLSDRLREALEERRERLAAGDLLRMLAILGELEPRFRKSGQQQLLLETMLVRFALLDRSVSIEEMLRGLGGGGGASSGSVSVRPASAAVATERASARPAPADRSWGAPSPSARSAPTSGPTRLQDSWPAAAPSAAPAPPSPSARQTAQASTPPADPRPARAAAPAAPAAAPAAGAEPPSVSVLTEQWDDVVARVRDAGRAVLATALQHAMPSAVSGRGLVTLQLDEPNDIYAQAFEASRDDLLKVLRELYPGVTRVQLAVPGGQPSAPVQRITAETIRAEREAALRRRDPALGPVIDALDLEVLD